MNTLINYVSWCCVLVVLAACTSANEENREELRLPEEAAMTLTPVAEIESAGEVYFSGFKKLLMTSDQRVIVNVWGHQGLLYFDRDGNFIDQIGRQGRGPGEFADIWDVLLAPGDTLHVFDRNNGRHQVLAKENGEWKQFREKSFAQGFREEIHSFYPSGIIAYDNEKYLSLFRNNIGIRDTTTMHYDWLQWTDMDLQPVNSEKMLFTPAEHVVVTRDEISILINTHPNGFKMFTQFEENEMAVHRVKNTDGEIKVLTPEGTVLRTAQLPIEKAAPDRSEMNEYYEQMNNLYGRETRNFAEAISLEHRPFIRQFILDNNGHYWINVTRENSDHPDWIVTDAGGVLLGSFRLEDTFDRWENFQLGAVRDGRLFGFVYKDEVPLFVIIDSSL